MGKKKLDIANNILEIDYFEDILEPSVSLRVKLDSAYSIVSGLPIRGGELVYFDIEVADRDFTRNTSENAFYVYKVAGQQSESVSEVCELLLTTKKHWSMKLQDVPEDTQVKSVLMLKIF